MKHKEEWVNEKSSNLAYQQIKLKFRQLLNEQAHNAKVNYYDFLLIAKKIGFRFQQSSHLMSLKNYFSKNKNELSIKKLVDMLVISSQCLQRIQQKIVVKFMVDTEFDPIHEVTNEDEENYLSEDQSRNYSMEPIGTLKKEQQNEIDQKTQIILSIKVQEMLRKIKLLINQSQQPNIFSVFQSQDIIDFQMFRKGIISIVSQSRFTLKISEEDVKAIFYFLSNQAPKITYENLNILKGTQFHQRMRYFYNQRINRDMVKNTIFKLGASKGSEIQIFQLKNASVLQFKMMEDSIVGIQRGIIRSAPKRVPHFGPLKGIGGIKKPYATHNLRASSSVDPIQNKNQVDKQRQRIKKILKMSSQEKKKDRTGDTVASKLRSLFIHKVILPREKMFDEEKQRLHKIKIAENHLSIRPIK